MPQLYIRVHRINRGPFAYYYRERVLARKGVTIVRESLRSNGLPSVDVTVFITVIY